MYKLCKLEQSANRQQKLEQGLLAAMQVCRYDDISISDLCGRLRIPRKSFYRYFSGKEGALHSLIDHTLMTYGGVHYDTVHSRSGMRQEMERFFAFWQEHRALLDALSSSGLIGVLVERAIDQAMLEVGHEATARTLHSEVSECAVIFAVCGLMTTVVRWQRSGYLATPSQMASVAAQILTLPLAGTLENLQSGAPISV